MAIHLDDAKEIYLKETYFVILRFVDFSRKKKK